MLTHTGHCLREIRHADDPGYLSGALATIWRARLGPMERLLLLCAAVEAADPDHREQMAFILGGPPPLGVAS